MKKSDIVIPVWKKTSPLEITRSLYSLLDETDLIGCIILVYDGHESFEIDFSIPDSLHSKIVFVYQYYNKGPGTARTSSFAFVKSPFVCLLLD